MKKYLILIILTLVIFGLLTFSTAQIETPADGDDKYGFPLTYYTKIGGMIYPAPSSESDLIRKNYLFLLVDIGFAFFLSFLFLTIYKKFSNRKKSDLN